MDFRCVWGCIEYPFELHETKIPLHIEMHTPILLKCDRDETVYSVTNNYCITVLAH